MESIPKVIEDIKNKILETAREQLLTNGYQKLALRNIAKECKIAVGTIYNYFSSKDLLVASIMVEDWKISLEKMRRSCKNSVDLINGFLCIYNSIIEFSDIYSDIWCEYSFTGNARYSFSNYHKLLRNQIAEIVGTLLKGFDKDEGEEMSVFLAESLLTIALQDDMEFEILSVVLNKLFI